MLAIVAANEYFDEIFGEKLAEMRAKSEADLEAARRIYDMLRFICPSNYFSRALRRSRTAIDAGAGNRHSS